MRIPKTRGGELGRVHVRDRGGGRFDRGLTRALVVSAREDPFLRLAQPDDRDGSDRDEQDGEEQRLPAIVAQGDHSTRRVALEVTTIRETPTNPSGIGTA